MKQQQSIYTGPIHAYAVLHSAISRANLCF